MVTDKDVDGNTCLSLAVENGHYEVVKLCLEKREYLCGPIHTSWWWWWCLNILFRQYMKICTLTKFVKHFITGRSKKVWFCLLWFVYLLYVTYLTP